MDEKKKKMSIVSINRDTMTQIRRYSMSGNDQGLYTTHLGYAYTYGDGGDVSCESLCEAVSLLFGEITVTFTALGSVVILEKAPIVSKNLEADKYENEKVKAAAEQFKSAEEGTAVSDIFAAAGKGTTVKDQNGEDKDISQYKTCGSLVEVAMKLGDEYFTNAECQFEGTVQMDLEQVDYKALLKSAGIDENTSDEDLLNVEEFEAPDYVLAQLNAVSGEASVSTGLKFGFEKVEGSDRPVLVIKGTFNGLGPVVLASKAE